MFGPGPVRIFERVAAFLMLSGLVLGLTADNLLGRTAVDTSLLPELFKSASLPASSLKKLAVGREEEATAIARRAVLRQPLSVEALAVLAQSSAIADSDMSSIVLAKAAALGWRNVFVQVAVINSAASVKSWRVVAPRVFALARLNELDSLDPKVFVDVDAPEHGSQMAPVFSSNGLAWFKFLKWLGEKGFKREHDGLLVQTPLFVREADCVRLGQAADELVREGQVSFAADLIGSRCKGYLTLASKGLAIDQHFGDSRRGPFEWQMIARPGVNLSIITKGGKPQLEVTNADPLPRTIASRIIRAEKLKGSRTLFFQRLDSGASRKEHLPLSAKCVERASEGLSGQKSFVRINSVTCSFLHITFQLPSGHFQVGTEF